MTMTIIIPRMRTFANLLSQNVLPRNRPRNLARSRMILHHNISNLQISNIKNSNAAAAN